MIECIICKKQFDKFDDYDRHLKTDHDILSVKERICDILSSRYDITRNYKGAIFSSDVHRKCFDESSSKKLGIVIDGKNVRPYKKFIGNADFLIGRKRWNWFFCMKYQKRLENNAKEEQIKCSDCTLY